MSAASEPIASAEQLALLDFQPIPEFREISRTKDATYDATLKSVATTIKLALRIVGKTKPEMIAMVREIGFDGDESATEELLDHFTSAREMLSAYLEVVDAAEIRTMAAIANCSPSAV